MKSPSTWPWGKVLIAVGVLAVGAVVGYIVALWQYVGGTPSVAIIGALTGLVGATGAVIAGVGGMWIVHRSRTKASENKTGFGLTRRPSNSERKWKRAA